jgi:hypothetical protein
VAASARPVPAAAWPGLAAPGVGELVGLALAVGADRSSAWAAAEEVAGCGVDRLRHTLPLLAAALADRLPVLASRHHDDATTTTCASTRPSPAPARWSSCWVPRTASTRPRPTWPRCSAPPWLARWSDEPAARRRGGGPAVLSQTRALPALAGRARAAGMPLVLAVGDPTLAEGVAPALAGGGRTVLLPSLDPDLVVLVVDADASPRRQRGATDRVVASHGARRPLVLALVGCSDAASPLTHAGRPVALLDGRPATRGTWTGVLLDALRAAADL